MHEIVAPEVKRERVLIPEEMTVTEVVKKFALKRPAARRAKKTDFS
jgi:hypothetical protein